MDTTPSYQPVQGKTYSLFGTNGFTGEYYEMVRQLADRLTNEFGSTEEALLKTRSAGADRPLERLVNRRKPPGRAKDILKLLGDDPYPFLTAIIDHLENRNRLGDLTGSIGTLVWQYPLFMTEIELSNRINIVSFKAASYRFALLPHCLRDVWDNCKAQVIEYDEVCQHCNKNCYLNHISRILEEKEIQPFIWTTRELKRMLGEIARKQKDFAVLGIACIPELVAGLRKCANYGVPAMGLPLNANCCARWFGECRESSVDLEELMKLV